MYYSKDFKLIFTLGAIWDSSNDKREGDLDSDCLNFW
jgi:hypothetical protein